MKKTLSALGALAAVTWAVSASAPTALAVNLLMDPSAAPSLTRPGTAAELRDGGTAAVRAATGIDQWIQTWAPHNGGTGDNEPTRPSNNGEKQPAFQLDDGSIRGGSTDFDGSKVIAMYAGDGSAAGKLETNEYDTSLGTTTLQYMSARFRGVKYNNNNGGTTAPGDILGTGGNHGDGIMMLQLKNGPAIGIEVFNSQSPTSHDVYSFNLFKYHTDSSFVPLQVLGLFHPNAGDDGTQQQSPYHTAEMLIDSATDRVQVAWDGVKVFDQVIGPWSTSGPAFFDSVDGNSLFGDKSLIIHGGNSNESTAAFSRVQLSGTPLGTLVPEPSTFVLGALGLVGLIGYARRRKA